MPSDRRPRPGTSRAYLLDRLERAGEVELLAAVEAGSLSAFAAAVEAGIVRRPVPNGRGSTNMAKRRAFAIARVFADAGRGRPPA
jgi:hypothetical protein